MDKNILEIRDLKKRFASGFTLDIKYLAVRENGILVLIGPNGSGKSTLIKIIDLLEKPDSANMLFKGKDMLGNDAHKSSIRKEMAAVFGEPLLFHASVTSNIIMGLGFRKILRKEKKDLFDYLVASLKLEGLLERSPKNLSSGEKQRVSLARALILEPSLLLLDEPLANIDQQSKESIRTDLFDVLKSIGRSAIYVTHDRSEAMMISDDIAVINQGRIEQSGPKEEVFRRPSNAFVAKFVGVDTLIQGKIDSFFDNMAKIAVQNKNGTLSYLFASTRQRQKKEVVVAIRPEDVILYSEEIDKDKTSAMNFFAGQVADIIDIGIVKKVDIDCGFILSAYVTSNSIERLHICKGSTIYASIKATSIHLF